MVESFVRMMDSEPLFIAPVNLGEFTMLELAESVLRLTGGQSKPAFHPVPNADPKQRQPDTSLAKEQLSWEPKVALADGLKETVAYFRKTLNV